GDAASPLDRGQCAARSPQRARGVECRADPAIPGMVRFGARRQHRLALAPGLGPAGTKYQPFKEAPYKDEFDEWLARIVCFAFSLPASAFTRQVNRATAETAQEAALAEGMAPLMGWVKRLADHVIQHRMGHADL